jgi:hypothetical protein
MGLTSRDLLLQVESLGYDFYEVTTLGRPDPAVKAEVASLNYTTSAK